jgi:hypothetical protein
MVNSVEVALRELGVSEEVTAVGQFQPRGHTGSMFAGGLVGDNLAGGLGGAADSVATVGGALAGARMHDASSGLPANMLVGVTPTHVCGFAAGSTIQLEGNRIPLTHTKDVIDALHG